MLIGFSFFWQVIPGLADPKKPGIWQQAIPNVDQALNKFKQLGIESIELKLTENIDFQLLFKAVEKLVKEGFHITFHAPGRFHYPDDVNQQLTNLAAITKFLNDELKLSPLWVVHPLNSATQQRSQTIIQTVHYLRQIQDSIEKFQARVALEILRNRADSGKTHVGDSYKEIVAILSNFQNDNIGICWDFGHAHAMYQRGLQEQFPPSEFLEKVIHCHVHDCYNQKTHLPLGKGDVAIQQNIRLLKQYNYQGILNLELAPHRIDDATKFIDYIEQSVNIIQTSMGKYGK